MEAPPFASSKEIADDRGITGNRGIADEKPGVETNRTLPLVLLHGFTGSAETMAELATSQQGRRTICPDLIGHGKSAAPGNAKLYSIENCCLQLHFLLENLQLPRCHLLGYSMGGRIALSFALAHPEKIASLILISSSPGLQNPKERRARRKHDQKLAKSIPTDGLEKFIKNWMNQPLFASQKRLGESSQQKSYSQRMNSNPDGLRNSLLGAGLGTMKPLWADLPRLKSPAFILTGKLDEKFSTLGRQMQNKMPSGVFFQMPDAGHAPHIEKPELTAAVLKTFLNIRDRLEKQ